MPRRRRQGANLYLRGSTWWCWYYDEHGTQVRVSTHQRDRSLAGQVALKLEREHFVASERPAPLPLDEALAEWLGYLEGIERSPETLSYYQKRATALLRGLGASTDAHSITAETLDAYMIRRRGTSIGKTDKTISRATVAKELGALRSCLLFHKRRGRYRGEPAGLLPDMRGAYVPRDRALTRDEYRKLHTALSDDRGDYLMGYVGLGPSQGELYRIEASDVRGGTTRIPGTKRSTRDRFVPLRPEVRAMLMRRAKAHPTGPLFPPWGNARRDLVAACVRAGIPPVSHNDLRRTFATWLAEAAVPEAVVAALMGHASSQMVRRVYTKVGRQAAKDAVALLPALGRRRL